MRIFVFGNINSGKSYLTEKLSSKFPKYKILTIDNFRRIYGNYEISGEILAQDNFINAVLNEKDCIVECTGIGPLGRKLAENMKTREDIVIKLVIDLDLCLSRLQNKDFTDIPYPYSEESIDNTIKRLNIEIADRAIEKIWKEKVISIITFDKLEYIPFKHYEVLNKVLNELYKMEAKSIISFGSLARNELNNNSDIDLFIETNYSIEKLYNIMKKKFNSFDYIHYLNNKLYFSLSGVFFELYIIKEYYEMDQYYKGSIIKDVSNTVLKGNNLIKEYLISINKQDEKLNKIINDLKEESRYYLYSLDSLIRKNDLYKFNFHCFILTHNYIRLKHLLNGHSDFNYLPKHAYKILNDTEKKVLFYNLNDINIDIKREEFDNLYKEIL